MSADSAPDRLRSQLGFGVYRISEGETQKAVEQALEAGYRLIDTAAAYGNERGVGAALRSAGAVDDVIVQTKLWISDYEDARRGFEKSARKLGTDTISSVLLHQPLPSRFDLTVRAYLALEELVNEGRIESIGVSNFDAAELDRLRKTASVTPAVNQVELHPYFAQTELQQEHARYGIATQAWSPLGGATLYGSVGGDLPVEDKVLIEIGNRYGKTPAQVILRWHLQQGRSAVPKSTSLNRIRENVDVFDFVLSDQDLATIDGLDRHERRGLIPAEISLETHFKEIPEQ